MTLDIYTELFTDEIGDALSTAIVALNSELQIIYMNAAAENLFGKSRNRVVNKPCTYLLGKNVDLGLIRSVIENTEPQLVRECQLQGEHHEDATLECVGGPLFKNGETVGVILELHRIDHQLRVAREEQQLNQQQATQTIIRGLAHEIKNPLGGLRGAAQLLESELDTSDLSNDLKEYTHVIISEADRLKKLVDRMLGSRQPIKNQMINIHEVLERVRKLVRADITEGITLKFDYDPSIPELLADKDNLIQIILNIVGNAIKAVGNSGTILFKTRILRNFTINNKKYRLAMRLEVIDDGVGVPKEIRDQLFFPMISGSAEGSGLGLSIAQSLANRHNGFIDFESEPGETRFCLILPITQQTTTDTMEDSSHG